MTYQYPVPIAAAALSTPTIATSSSTSSMRTLIIPKNGPSAWIYTGAKVASSMRYDSSADQKPAYTGDERDKRHPRYAYKAELDAI
jgi:hypothetical protein